MLVQATRVGDDPDHHSLDAVTDSFGIAALADVAVGDWVVTPRRGKAVEINALWYNVFATNDAVSKLGGNPYGNRGRWYFGSSNDLRLNLLVRRFSGRPYVWPKGLSAVTGLLMLMLFVLPLLF